MTDAGVGALCARTAIEGAFLNVKVRGYQGWSNAIWRCGSLYYLIIFFSLLQVNLGSVSDKEWVADMKTKSTSLLEKAKKVEAEIMKQVGFLLAQLQIGVSFILSFIPFYYLVFILVYFYFLGPHRS